MENITFAEDNNYKSKRLWQIESVSFGRKSKAVY